MGGRGPHLLGNRRTQPGLTEKLDWAVSVGSSDAERSLWSGACCTRTHSHQSLDMDVQVGSLTESKVASQGRLTTRGSPPDLETPSSWGIGSSILKGPSGQHSSHRKAAPSHSDFPCCGKDPSYSSEAPVAPASSPTSTWLLDLNHLTQI